MGESDQRGQRTRLVGVFEGRQKITHDNKGGGESGKVLKIMTTYICSGPYMVHVVIHVAY